MAASGYVSSALSASLAKPRERRGALPAWVRSIWTVQFLFLTWLAVQAGDVASTDENAFLRVLTLAARLVTFSQLEEVGSEVFTYALLGSVVFQLFVLCMLFGFANLHRSLERSR